MRLVFGFSRPVKENILSSLIRAVEKRPFSHAYVRFDDPCSSRSIIAQASGLFINLMPVENFKKIEEVVEEYEVEIAKSMDSVVINYIISSLGTPYSVMQLIAIFVKKLFNIKLRFGDNGINAEICSEFAARVASIAGLSDPADLDFVTPSDFQKFCSANMKRVV